MEAEQQHLVGRRADPAVGRLDQAQPQVARRVGNVVEVARDAALRRQHHDAAGVRELVVGRVVAVAEADRPRELVNRPLFAGEEVPAGLGARSAVALQVGALLGRGQLRRLARVETNGQNVEVAAHVERHLQQGADQSVEHLRAEHRAAVVRQDQDDRPLAEVVAEPDGLPRLIAEGQVERHLRVEFLVEAHPAQRRRQLRVGWRGTRRQAGADKQDDCDGSPHGASSRSRRPEFGAPPSTRPLPLRPPSFSDRAGNRFFWAR